MRRNREKKLKAEIPESGDAWDGAIRENNWMLKLVISTGSEAKEVGIPDTGAEPRTTRNTRKAGWNGRKEFEI
jgi:hypothetical protein